MEQDFQENNRDVKSLQKRMKVAVGTWNVSSEYVKEPKRLKKWLTLSEEADIIAIGLQEVDMGAMALLKKGTKARKKWDEILIEAVSYSPHKYSVIGSKQLVGVYLIVFVKIELAASIREMKMQKIGCGILGRMGNKGCVAMRFELFGKTFCFVSSHLAAHQKAVKKRNQNFNTLEGKINFKLDPESFNCKVHDYHFSF